MTLLGRMLPVVYDAANIVFALVGDKLDKAALDFGLLIDERHLFADHNALFLYYLFDLFIKTFL